LPRSALSLRRLRSVAIAVIAVMATLPAVATAETQEFTHTGADQTFTVPAGVTSVAVTAVGAPGETKSQVLLGGRAATVSAILAVMPGQTLYVEVGTTTGEAKGFNGGGPYGGGDATDVRTLPRVSAGTLESRLIVAAGGGAAGEFSGKDADVPFAGSLLSGHGDSDRRRPGWWGFQRRVRRRRFGLWRRRRRPLWRRGRWLRRMRKFQRRGRRLLARPTRGNEGSGGTDHDALGPPHVPRAASTAHPPSGQGRHGAID
jgi:Glycine rich protein